MAHVAHFRFGSIAARASLFASTTILLGSVALYPVSTASAAERGPAVQTLEKPVAAPWASIRPARHGLSVTNPQLENPARSKKPIIFS